MAHKLAHLSTTGVVHTLTFSDVISAAEANKLGVMTVEPVVRITRHSDDRFIAEEYPLVPLARRIWAATARAKDWYRVV